jgi:(S)-ureidoglycine aminohydrolase
MHRLGFTRSAHRADHLLQTEDTFVRAPRPGMRNATAIVHIAPARGARFTQYTAEFEPGGCLGPADGQRFIYVMEGSLRVDERHLGPGGFAYFPAGSMAALTAAEASRAAVIEKPYIEGAPPNPPRAFIGHENDVTASPLGGDPDLLVRCLIPDNAAYDFAVNTMVYQPGAALPMVEIHVMEHGLVMLEGGGIYRLGESWYPVTAGDFIWMAPYCPQWFGALGKSPAKYLIYKDWNR